MTQASRGLLIKVRGNGDAFAKAAAHSFGAAAVEVEPILRVPAPPSAPAMEGMAASEAATWLRMKLKAPPPGTIWDQAHGLLAPGEPFALEGPPIERVEPDFEQSWPPYGEPVPHGAGFAAAADICAYLDQDTGGGRAAGPGIAWNFGDGFSELAKARSRVGDKLGNIRIAHLDTGFDPRHITKPKGLRNDLQRNFVEDDGTPNDASDQTPDGMKAVRTRGHGTATIALLAGNALDGSSPSWKDFTDFVGGAPLAQIIPVRIANWVVRFTTSTMVKGFNYAREQGAHVLSMSMGGLSSDALVDAVNLAYEAGIVMVTAAGNNFAGAPMPQSIVFPARLRRVLAACGVMADGRAYAGLDVGTMQGSYGPASKMATALGAYTPNVPWAQIDCAKVVDMDGGGTSSATPQIAAAAALWLGEHWDVVSRYSQPWMRVEAVRYALFTAAAKSTARMNAAETFEKIGQGVLKADAALAVAPPAEEKLHKLPPAQASWSWLDMIFGGGVSLAPSRGVLPKQRAMLALELTQMAQSILEVDQAIDDVDRPAEQISTAERKRYLEAALDHGNPSRPLRVWLEGLLGRTAVTPAITPADTSAKPASRPVRRKQKALRSPTRRLRVYALDPSLAKGLDWVAVNETTLAVPWDDKPEADNPLLPGPVGEYLEVVDIDPASSRFYEPVDLNDRRLLAQDGWPPSEGNPQFHQQMVYAVGMTIIGHFERALGRKALWAPHRVVSEDGGKEDWKTYEVRRLRIYPHALRTDNAYYSPDKKALLFGYFPAESKIGNATPPGTMVFSCLSSDIVAHVISHALLDGLHRRFEDVSNPDVPAFHEAFADIVALFHHFTIEELVRFSIGQAGGKLSANELLGGLARQFGEATSRNGPLRNYLGEEIRSLTYPGTEEVHARGSILVSAVYQAFIKIVENRTADLRRLATGGSGILPAGSLPPDLIDRLTVETCKAARHVLQICIRALDYCPAIDITFGEYLRALITADRDLLANDRFHYRVAFMEAFSSRGILPYSVRTVSEESLAWGTLEDPQPKWLKKVIQSLDVNLNRLPSRAEIFALNEKNRRLLWGAMNDVFISQPDLYREFGLLPDIPRYNERGQEVKRAESGHTTFEVFNVRPARRVDSDGGLHTELIATIHQRRPVALDGKDMTNGWFWFRGGATLIIDPRLEKPEIRYVLTKNIASQERLERQRRTVSGNSLSPLRALYFGDASGEPFAMMHAKNVGDANA